MLPRGRTPEQVFDHAYRGFIGEITYNEELGPEAKEWWVAQRLSLRGKTSDSGSDARDGANVKVILPGDQRVFVGDDRAQTYVVYRYDPRGFIEKLGTFVKGDIGALDVGGQGVYVSDLDLRV